VGHTRNYKSTTNSQPTAKAVISRSELLRLSESLSLLKETQLII